MNENKPNPAGGGRYVLGDDGEHVPEDQVTRGAAEAEAVKPAPAAAKKTIKREVKNATE